MSNLTTGSGIFFMENVMGDGSLLGMFSMMKMFPVIIALIFTPILVKKLGSMQKVNFWGYFISDVLGIFLIYFSMQRNLTMMLLFMFLKGTFAGTLTGTLNALIAEISGYTYRTKGVHIDGMMFSCSSLGVKVGGRYRNCRGRMAAETRRICGNCRFTDAGRHQHDFQSLHHIPRDPWRCNYGTACFYEG